MSKPSSIQIFQSLTQEMGARVPENFLSYFIIKSNQLHKTISLQRSRHVPKLIVTFFLHHFFSFSADRSFSKGRFNSFGIFDLSDDGCFSQILRNGFGESEGGCNEGLSFELFSIFELNKGILTVIKISGLSAASRILLSFSFILVKRTPLGRLLSTFSRERLTFVLEKSRLQV